MQQNWKEIGENISEYIDDDEFLSERKPLEICKILNYATLTACQFSNLFKNLAEYHGRDDMFKMISRARTVDFKTQDEVEEVEETFTSVLGIPSLNKVFSFYKNIPHDEKAVHLIKNYSNSSRNGNISICLKYQGSSRTLKIDNKINSTELLNMIAAEFRVCKDDIKVTCGPKQIYCDRPLSDYNIQDDCVINIRLRCLGGKPVIYLYPKEEIDVKVNIKVNDGVFSFVYPSFDEGSTWNVKASPTGEINHRGKKLRYLFWETLFYPNLQMDKGFVIKGKDSVEFFEEKLKFMNLNDSEICDFVTYWCPKLAAYNYLKIYFQLENFDEMCPLCVDPKPDNINRVFFAALPLQTPCDVEPQDLPRFKRDGFTVIEWGGTIVSQLNS